MFGFQFTSESLSLVVGAVVSLLFSYFPALNTWFAAKQSSVKCLIMIGVMVVVSGSIFGLGCANIITMDGFVCAKESVMQFVSILIAAVVANQGAYMISPQTDKVLEVKYGL